MKFAEFEVSAAEGAILAHSVKHQGGIFRKGRVLSESDVELLEASGVKRIFAARLESGDVAEDAAAEQVAKAIAGSGVSVQEPFTGRSNLHAMTAGVFTIDGERLKAVNRLHESLTVATVAPFAAV